jgi:methylated-DNA-[protein]-cysteine S-methyltransferase
MANKRRARLCTPIGTLLLQECDGRLTDLTIIPPGELLPDVGAEKGPVLDRALSELEEYFAGRRTSFDLPLAITARSEFGQHVLQRLFEVPYGETISYGELAAQAGSPRAARAVGRVMAANPLPIIIPCHRVVLAGGLAGGYSGGGQEHTKRWLLDFERGHCGRNDGRIPVKVSEFSD